MTDPVTDQKEQHDRVDPIFKEILTALGEEYALPIDTEVETGRLPRKIDGLMRLDTSKLVK